MHLADTLIQSQCILQCIQSLYFISMCVPWTFPDILYPTISFTSGTTSSFTCTCYLKWLCMESSPMRSLASVWTWAQVRSACAFPMSSSLWSPICSTCVVAETLVSKLRLVSFSWIKKNLIHSVWLFFWRHTDKGKPYFTTEDLPVWWKTVPAGSPMFNLSAGQTCPI